MRHSDNQPESQAGSDSPTTGASLPRIVRNSTFNALGMVLIVPLNFLALFTMARRLGAEAMGVYFTIFAICAVLHWIADAGATTILTRRVARMPEDLRTIVAESMGMTFLVSMTSLSLMIGICAPLAYLSLGYVPWLVLIIAAAAMMARHMMDFASNIFRGLERFEFENLIRVLQAGSFCAFVWFGVHPGPHGAVSAYLAFTASNYLAAFVVWGILLVGWCCPRPRLNFEIARRWLTESVPLGISDVVRQLYMQLDTLLLALLSPAVAVGLFSVAARPLQPLRLVPRTIVSVTFPMMSRAAHVDRAQLSRLFAKTTNLLWVASLPICISVTLIAAPLVLRTAGPGFADAIGPLRFLIWATVLMFINAQHRFVFTAIDAEQAYWRLTVASLAAKVPLCAGAIYLFGLYGACIGTLIGELLLTLGGAIALRDMHIAGPSWLQLARAIPAGICMTLTLMPFVEPDSPLWWLVMGLALSSGVYLACSLLAGAWPREDALQFKQALRRSFGGAGKKLATSQAQ